MTTRTDDASGPVHREIEALLNRSAAAWSAGDLDEFMECYENSADTIYLTATRIVAGYAEIRSMYAQRFGAGSERSMGILAIEVVRVTLLGSEHALAVGSISLEGVRGGHKGVCSLILHKTSRGWRISADHTS